MQSTAGRRVAHLATSLGVIPSSSVKNASVGVRLSSIDCHANDGCLHSTAPTSSRATPQRSRSHAATRSTDASEHTRRRASRRSAFLTCAGVAPRLSIRYRTLGATTDATS